MSASPRRLVRTPEDKKLAGVCGGLAEYFGVDPNAVRLAAVAAALVTGGAAALAYVVAVFLLPVKGADNA
jgi:phage shock protein PspC (stress-responsive transcriptional regulator)